MSQVQQRVAIAVLRRDGQILLRQRREDETLPGLWEFPGGKVEDGETPEEAAAREVREEMGVEAVGLTLLRTIDHAYSDRNVQLWVFEGTCSGEPRTPDGARWTWTTAAGLAHLPVPAANKVLIESLAAGDRNLARQ